MLKKETVKGLIIGAAAALTVTTMVTAFSETIEKAISVVFDDYHIYIDGADKSDIPDGKSAFIYDGTTYVPLRYIGESMGKQVTWDGNTKSIYINDDGSKREDVYFAKTGYESVDYVKADSHVSIYLDDETNDVYLYNGHNVSFDGSITYNLNGLAKTIYGTIDTSETTEDSCEGQVIFYDQDDNVIYESPKMRNSTDPISFEIPVSGVLQLKVRFIQNLPNSGEAPNVIRIKDFRYSK